MLQWCGSFWSCVWFCCGILCFCCSAIPQTLSYWFLWCVKKKHVSRNQPFVTSHGVEFHLPAVWGYPKPGDIHQLVDGPKLIAIFEFHWMLPAGDSQLRKSPPLESRMKHWSSHTLLSRSPHAFVQLIKYLRTHWQLWFLSGHTCF